MLYGGVKATFLAPEAPEEKKAALRGFVLPTYFPTYIISLAEEKNSMPYHRIPHYVLNIECQLREWELSILNVIHTSVYIIQFLLCLKKDYEKDCF